MHHLLSLEERARERRGESVREREREREKSMGGEGGGCLQRVTDRGPGYVSSLT